MRKGKTFFVALVVSFLVLSPLMASGNMWAWVGSRQSTETSEVQTETLMEVPETSEMASTSSESISEEDDEWVVVKKSDLNKVVGKFESAASFTSKAKENVAEAKSDLDEAVTPYVPVVIPTVDKFKPFMTIDAEHGLNQGLRLGFTAGFIFKDCLMFSAGIMKEATLNGWMDIDAYTARASIGIVF